MVSRIALVGASHLVSFERQPWESCLCLEPCRDHSHCPQVQNHAVYKTFATSGATFDNPFKEKNFQLVLQDARKFRLHVLVLFHDAIMNSLTLPNHAPANAKSLTPTEVINRIRILEDTCPAL